MPKSKSSKKQSSKKKSGFKFDRRLQLILFVVIVGLLVGVGYYAVQVFENSEAEQVGFVICNEEKCEKSDHIHADIYVSVCGDYVRLPKNMGSVIEQHTHAEQDYLHKHFTFDIDRETQEPVDTTLHKLNNFFVNLEIPFSSDPATLGDYTVGDTCPNGTILTQEHLNMTVNGVKNTQFEDYIWEDGDDIVLTFE